MMTSILLDDENDKASIDNITNINSVHETRDSIVTLNEKNKKENHTEQNNEPENGGEHTSLTIPEDLQRKYINWKKNAKILYDYLNSNTSKWPSLTCEIFPDVEIATEKRRILLSSFTSSQLPLNESIYISSISTDIPKSSLNQFDMDEMEFKIDNDVKQGNKKLAKQIEIGFPIGEECNRARYMPLNPDIIGCASSSGNLYIYNRTKHGSLPRTRNGMSDGNNIAVQNEISRDFYEVVYKDEDRHSEAYSLAWNYQRNGIVATCHADGTVNIWNLSKTYKKSNSKIITTKEHDFFPDIEKGCNDVSWMVHHESILAVGCESNNKISIIDTRTNHTPYIKATDPLSNNTASASGINSVQFNYQNDLLLCSGNSNSRVGVWDLRNMGKPVNSWNHGNTGNSGSISSVAWNPNISNVLASAGLNDGLVKIWDASDIEDPLLFTHGGHMLGVNDISWDLHDSWLMCSVSNDNSIQIWKPSMKQLMNS
ncbi:related to Chromatin assembly factor 1 subunit p50 [Saccharomycodes ludwigii]|uniref:Related to Chromatin assembly factor 1 subunit p50 n=1 Tax=Saccharomycodes ludwigii TaxID=36035 RepID=A0A376B660_9ASCO|nr:hypothetical protein SCDLUD_002018 [Saccharomycodes ludwigii]KAH3902203.1 hypothetical protein SCDLUD_002018 [Saccharomycodes ludwigii]SSD60121.1 related to Chromatin assembly factor 1 subunit p50 [Saccharomycodes ludwigii]